MANAFAAAAEKARAANEERYSQGMSLWDQIIQRYQPGGAFGAGALASYERGKTKAIGAGMQQLVSSGLANTTIAATMGSKYEEEVGTPFRTQLEDMRMDRLSGAQEGKAGFIERREDIGPSGALAMQSGQQAGYAASYGAGRSDDYTLPGFGKTTSATKQPSTGSTSFQGANYQASRAGTPYQYKGPNIGQITYQGEQSAAPTYGETGGPAGPPLPEGYSPVVGGGTKSATSGLPKNFDSLSASQQKISRELLAKGYTYSESAVAWSKSDDSSKKASTPTPKVGTTSYAAKGGGFGGRGF